MPSTEEKPKLVLFVRWLARIWSLLLVILAILEVISPSEVNRPVPWHEFLSPLLLIAGVSLGFILGWFWEGVAGLIIVMGFLAAQITACLSRGECLPFGVVVLLAVLFLTPGLLYFASWYLAHIRYGQPG